MYRDKPEHVAINYKNWSTDEAWQPTSADSLEIFKVDAEGKQTTPSGRPDVVLPEFERKNNFENIKNNLERVKHFLNYEQFQWWSQFLEQPDSVSGEQYEWYLDSIRPQLLPEPREAEHDGATFFSPLQLAMEKERQIPPVYTGRKRAAAKKPPTPSKQKRPVDKGLGYMIAVEEADELFVGEITSIGDRTVEIKLFTGALNSPWNAVETQQGNYCVRTIQKASIKDDMFFSLTPSLNLPAHMKVKLDKLL